MWLIYHSTKLFFPRSWPLTQSRGILLWILSNGGLFDQGQGNIDTPNFRQFVKFARALEMWRILPEGSGFNNPRRKRWSQHEVLLRLSARFKLLQYTTVSWLQFSNTYKSALPDNSLAIYLTSVPMVLGKSEHSIPVVIVFKNLTCFLTYLKFTS